LVSAKGVSGWSFAYKTLRWSIVFYGASYAPYFTRGMWAMIAVSIAMAIWTALLVWMQVRTEKKRDIGGTATPLAEKEHGSIDGQEKVSVSGNIDQKV
jgi:MFS transporter, ACS family, pantothenate transporter